MADHKIYAKVTIVGVNGETKSLDWSLNWDYKRPEKLKAAVSRLAESVGLDTDWYCSNELDDFQD